MTEQAKEARRAYKRKWAREHPENVRAHQQRYWERIAAERTATAEQAAALHEAAQARTDAAQQIGGAGDGI